MVAYVHFSKFFIVLCLIFAPFGIESLIGTYSQQKAPSWTFSNPLQQLIQCHSCKVECYAHILHLTFQLYNERLYKSSRNIQSISVVWGGRQPFAELASAGMCSCVTSHWLDDITTASGPWKSWGWLAEGIGYFYQS